MCRFATDLNESKLIISGRGVYYAPVSVLQIYIALFRRAAVYCRRKKPQTNLIKSKRNFVGEGLCALPFDLCCFFGRARRPSPTR